jgi:hypothetical protein
MHVRAIVHCKREPFDVYIGRPSKWGNPYPLSDQSRGATLALYRSWILNRQDLIKDLPELNGKILGCWCSPNPCHGDILNELLQKYPEIEAPRWAWWECPPENDCY